MWRIGLHRPNREPRNVRVTPPKRFLEQADEPPTRRLDAAVRNLPARVVETRDTQLIPVNDHVDHRRRVGRHGGYLTRWRVFQTD
jgi:hypothetical protein